MNKKILIFCIKFLGFFALFYFGTLAIIGLASPGKLYSPFVARYLDFVSLIKWTLLHGSKGFLALLGIPGYIEPDFIMRGENGYGVKLEMDCVGYGVYSFWAAYILAGEDQVKRKILWLTGGLLLLWAINVARISGVLVALNRNWAMPLGIDHHTWFNIFAYLGIFTMMFFYERKRLVEGRG